MAESFKSGTDLHSQTASGIFDVGIEAVTPEQRQTAKRLNFSIVYGGGVPTLVRQGVASDGKEALQLLRKFHAAWPGIGWQRKNQDAQHGTLAWYIQERIAQRGYITTLWGRHLHPLNPHAALNALVQGCAADLMKWALINIYKNLKAKGLTSHLVLTVHDNAMLDCVQKEMDFLLVNVPNWMVYELVDNVVPIKPEPEVSFITWADLEAA